jgi:hypothetical protein
MGHARMRARAARCVPPQTSCNHGTESFPISTISTTEPWSLSRPARGSDVLILCMECMIVVARPRCHQSVRAAGYHRGARSVKLGPIDDTGHGNQNQNQIYSRMTRCYRTLLKFGLLPPKRGNGLYHWRHSCLTLRCRRAPEGIEGPPG